MGIETLSKLARKELVNEIRESTGNRKKKRVFRKLSKEIAIKTSHDWQDSLPGYVEIDFVVHGGGSMSGEYPTALLSLMYVPVGRKRCPYWPGSNPWLLRGYDRYRVKCQ